MTNVTISGNRAGTEGGALQLHLADVSLNHVTVAYNKLESCAVPSCTGGIGVLPAGATIHMAGTVLTNNDGTNCPNSAENTTSGGPGSRDVISAGFNLDPGGFCVGNVESTDITDTPFESLLSNELQWVQGASGDHARVHAPVSGSPALDRIP